MRSLWRRAAWLALFGGVLGGLILKGLAEVRQRERHRALLLEVQQALQKYHVDQERYVPRRELKGSELIAVLDDLGFFPALPVNPWTGQKWKLDGQEPDHLAYRTDANFETYALRILAPDGGQTLMELDSEAKISLE